MTIIFILLPIITFAQEEEDQGPDPPPQASIDSLIFIAIVFAMILAFYYLNKIDKDERFI